MITKPGHYYGRLADGRLMEVSAEDVNHAAPDAVICRRVVDFPGRRVPDGALVAVCRDCQLLVAFNPVGPFLDRPRLCLQCAGIKPLPL